MSNIIDRATIEKYYELSRKVHDGEITPSDARAEVQRFHPDRSDSSFTTYYHYAFKYMVEGKGFTGDISNDAIDYYLENIRKDYGREGLRNAIESVEKYIVHYESKHKIKSKLNEKRKILNRHQQVLDSQLTEKSITQKTSSKTYLFAWNPNNWLWEGLEENIEELQNSGSVKLRWSCRSHKSVKIGDRAFLVRLGSNPRGIMASGTVASLPFLARHWNGEEKQVERVIIEFDAILNPVESPILPLDSLLPSQKWTPQSSGISISKEAAEDLEKKWFEFINRQEYSIGTQTKEAEKATTFIEGASRDVIQTFRERNPYARKVCLEEYGYTCQVCCFDFVKQYGLIGKEFIHVHHLNMVSSKKGEYELNPVEDLRPVCPNCHAMIHKRNPPYSIEEMKELINTNFCAPQT